VARGPLAKLIYGEDGSIVEFDGGELTIAGGPTQRRLTAKNIVQPAEPTGGLLWSSLVLETTQGPVPLKGYRASSLGGIADLINQALASEAVERLEARCVALHDVHRSIETRTGYFKESERMTLVARATKALNFRRDRLWEVHATDEQREAYRSLQRWVSESSRYANCCNERYVTEQLAAHADLFDSVESMPLTRAQRFAAVRDEDNNLVLAGAGTGKTSTMVGRAAYLIAAGIAKPGEILMVAYGSRAAQEMQERQESRLKAILGDGAGPTIKTFHALGLDIVGKVDGRRPDVSILATDEYSRSSFISNTIEVNCDDPVYRANLVRYLGTDRFVYRSPFDFESMEAYNEYVREEELRTLRGEAVKSFEELEIANLLNAYSVDYRYEAPYEHPTAGPEHRQYKPDFYLPAHGIYIEHFALDRDGMPPSHFKDYLEGVQWKRALHVTHATRLIESYSYQKREGVLESSLMAHLHAAGVPLVKRDDNEMLREMREQSLMLEFASFVGSFIGLAREAGLDESTLRSVVSSSRDPSRFESILDIAGPVLHAYVEELHARGEVDFADMIHAATKHVASGAYVSPYTHIMIDEFQDISAPRARLAQALQRQREGCSLFAVGDDWQAIYRFAGSDVTYTSDFESKFGPTATTALDKTFRFNDQIERVSSNFVLRNPAQSKKTFGSLAKTDGAAVSIIGSIGNRDGLDKVLAEIHTLAREGPETSILVLARFGFVLDEIDVSARRQIKAKYPSLRLQFATAHSAKGKEAEYVVVLGMTKGKYGFPSRKRTDEVLEALLPPAEGFRFAEERRLFYVALTRAKHHVYLVFDPMKRSEFVFELMQNPADYPVSVVPIDGMSQAVLHSTACPRCKDGSLVPRRGDNGAFYGCDNFPYCEHTEPGCPSCGSPMESHTSVRVCSNGQCDRLAPSCPECGAPMEMRKGQWGAFWGCTHYRGDDAFSCKGKARTDAFPSTGSEWAMHQGSRQAGR